MDFASFLQSIDSPDFWRQRKNFCFVSNSYPAAWMTMLFSILNRKNLLPGSYQRIFMQSSDKKSLYPTLSQSILGNFSFFWLGDLSEEKESKALNELVDFLFNYQGPHGIAYFINSSSKFLAKRSGDTIITLPHEMTASQFVECLRLFDIVLDTRKMAYVKNIFASYGSIQLDQACMLVNYLELIATKHLSDYLPFLASVTGAAPSLSTLPELFFSKNIQAFFSAWSIVKNDYSDIFWVTFWADQIWKAYHVIGYLKNKDFVGAKRMSYRLPYTFVNRDWKKTNAASLVQAYKFLYQVDYASKNGSTFSSLDLFYMNYFMGKF